MTMEAAAQFADRARDDADLQTRLEAVTATDPEARIEALIEIGAQAGYEFTSEDYYNSGSQRALEVNQPWPVAEAAPVTSPLQPYAQYGFPYSAYPPIPPPMPTYLPPPPYIPIPQAAEGA